MRLLLADDNVLWRDVIVHLAETEYEIVGFVEHGDQILEAAESLRPDVITLDVRMPGPSGLNILPHLRKLLPDAIVVVVSAETTPIYMQEAFARGADGYVDKRRISIDLLQTMATTRERKRSGNRSDH
jgi:two-component system, chemotaxis family, chemotaxis protein CheY